MARRLAAIVFTDIAGYTSLTQKDEASALRLLQDQQSLVQPLLETFHGRKVKSMGDGLLLEFPDALEAVECGVELQRRAHERNSRGGAPPLRMRVGIHLGDVQEEGSDILGDAVNIASRVEPLAEPEGVCVSFPVHDQVHNKVKIGFESLGLRKLKGVQDPIDVYRAVFPWSGRLTPSEEPGAPRLAVLPLANISPDARDEYIADGLTEELITVLSQMRDLRVIARTSVIQYKATSKPIAQIGAELDVSSILEGSVRKDGNRLRITVQLIDVASQGHVWANTYDRELDNIFAIQGDIAKRVGDALRIEMRSTEQGRLGARPPVRTDSYLAYLKGRTLFYELSKTSLDAAKDQFELAISLDPKNAAAYSGLADGAVVRQWMFGEAPQAESREAIRRFALRAIDLDPSLAEAHTSLGVALMGNSESAAAEREFKLAVSLNPSYSQGHHWYAELLQAEGRSEEALVEWSLAEAVDPSSSSNLGCSAWCLIWLGRLDEAFVHIQKLERVQSQRPDYPYIVARYLLGRSDLEGCVKQLRHLEGTVLDTGWKRVAQALGHALSGEKEMARSLLRDEESLPKSVFAHWIIVWTYCELGDLDECFRWIEKGVPFEMMRLDPRFQPIHRDPRFQSVLKNHNLP